MADGGNGGRRAAFWASAAVLVVACAITGRMLSAAGTPHAIMVVHGVLFAAGLLVWLTALQWPSSRTTVILLALAVVARVALLPFPPSDDMHRYLWEGRLILAGESPYARPAADAPAEWQDADWAAMNNRDKLTVYPPLAQLLFAVGAALGPVALKLVIVAADMAVLGLLAGVLRRRGLPAAHLALAAFNPVALLAGAAEGHFDAVFVLAALLALITLDRRRPLPAWGFLALAVQLKVVAVVLAPLFLRAGGWRAAWLFLAVNILAVLPWAGDLGNLLRGIFAFGTGGTHNGFLNTVVRFVLPDLGQAAAVTYGLLAAWIAVVTFRISDPLRAGFFILGGVLVLSPITHFWYFAWIVPFLALMPQPAWLLLTALQAFYVTAWATKAATGAWYQPEWAWWGQWLPFAVVLLATGLPALRRLAARPSWWPPPTGVAAIIPVIDEAERVVPCVRALARQRPALTEIVVVDGGSRDATVRRAVAAGATVVTAPRGRGSQIAAGIAASRADVVWVVHADVLPAPDTASTILAALAADAAVAGGACGQRFARLSPMLMVIEWLNAGRSAAFGLAFGDQGQFVRRHALPAVGGFPDLPLMEDVELSLRLRHIGPTLHLGLNGRVSTRRWRRSSARRRAWTIVRLTAAYLASRRRRELANELFRIYYPAKGD